MRNCLIIILIFSFLCAGCTPYIVFSPAEKEARDNIQKALFYERISRFEPALKEYSIVMETYPGSAYYKEAVFNSALIHMDTENPDADYGKALELIEKYLELSLSKKETKIAKAYQTVLIELHRKDKFISRQKKDINTCKARQEALKEKLQKMKEIDVQMYENKFNQN